MKQITSIFLVFFLFLIGCSSGNDDSPTLNQEVTEEEIIKEESEESEESETEETEGENTSIENPESVILVFPYEASECEEGTDVTEDESTVTFEWQIANHTDSYELVIKNLNTTIEESFTTTQGNMAARLERGVPYEWYVISRSNSTSSTANSEIWRFYNQGLGTENHIPFPAEVVSPQDNGEHNFHVVDLEWSGSDVDNDILGYDVYFGIQNPPVNKLAENTQNSTVTNIQVSIATYYWYVITRDSKGNESESQIFNFVVRQ